MADPDEEAFDLDLDSFLNRIYQGISKTVVKWLKTSLDPDQLAFNLNLHTFQKRVLNFEKKITSIVCL